MHALFRHAHTARHAHTITQHSNMQRLLKMHRHTLQQHAHTDTETRCTPNTDTCVLFTGLLTFQRRGLGFYILHWTSVMFIVALLTHWPESLDCNHWSNFNPTQITVDAFNTLTPAPTEQTKTKNARLRPVRPACVSTPLACAHRWCMSQCLNGKKKQP